jgi:hypothetical protein
MPGPPYPSLTPPVLLISTGEPQETLYEKFISEAKCAARQGDYALAIGILAKALFDTEWNNQDHASQVQSLSSVWNVIDFHARLSLGQAADAMLNHYDSVAKRKQADFRSRGISRTMKEKFRSRLWGLSEDSIRLGAAGDFVATLCAPSDTPLTQEELVDLQRKLVNWRI